MRTRWVSLHGIVDGPKRLAASWVFPRTDKNYRNCFRLSAVWRALLVGFVLGFAGGGPVHAYFGAKFEPPDGKVLHGAGDTEESFDSYTLAVAPHTPAVFMAYCQVQVGKAPPRIEYYLDKYPGIVPQIGLAWTEKRDGKAMGLDEALVNGEFDDAVKSLARYLRDLKRPVFVRPGFEFNGSWNNYDPKHFSTAFRRIVSIFRRTGAKNVAFIWCFEPSGNPDFMKWYPGDGWVDWWGIDLFSPEQISSENTHRFLKQAQAHRKPVMICESSPRYVETTGKLDSWKLWFAPYFELIRQNPHIKGFCYINADWRQRRRWMDWGDCRIEKNEALAELYRGELAHKAYIHLRPALNSALGYDPLLEFRFPLAGDASDSSPRHKGSIKWNVK